MVLPPPLWPQWECGICVHDDLFRLYGAQQRPPQSVLKQEIHHRVDRNHTGLGLASEDWQLARRTWLGSRRFWSFEEAAHSARACSPYFCSMPRATTRRRRLLSLPRRDTITGHGLAALLAALAIHRERSELRRPRSRYTEVQRTTALPTSPSKNSSNKTPVQCTPSYRKHAQNIGESIGSQNAAR